MTFELSEMQANIRVMAKEFAQKYLAPRVDEIETADKFPQDLAERMGETGFLGLTYPEAYGGLDMGFSCMVIVLEEFAKVSASAAELLAVCFLGQDAINFFGSEKQKQKYLPDMIAGKDLGSFAFTEPGTGSDPKQLTTVNRKKDGRYVINGVKRFISNAAHEGTMVVYARDEDADTCTGFIIKKFCKGYSISTPWEKIGLHGSHVYDVFLDDVEVEEEDILGQYGGGFGSLIDVTAYGKIAFAAFFAGTMEGAYELTVKYINEKMHRGASIRKFPTIQHKISQIAANVISAQLMLYRAAYDADSIKDNRRRVQAVAALAKGYIADLATSTITMCLNLHAAYGVTAEYKVERYLRDAIIFPNIEGSADIQRLISGGYILNNSDLFLT